jgi:hypothetical protein
MAMTNDDIWIAIRGERWRLREAVDKEINKMAASHTDKAKAKATIGEGIIQAWKKMHESLCNIKGE